MNSLRHYIDILYEAEYDTRISKLTQLYPDHKTDFDWAKTNLVRKDRIYWYLKQVENLIKNNKPQDIKPLQDNLYHYIGQTDIQGIQNYPFNINQTTQELFNQLQQIEQKYHSNTRPTALTTPNDVDLIKYPDGTRWVKLDRAYCEKEGRSGKHCGNLMGQHIPNQRILSYRDNQDRVILTFILEPNGTLGEMKGILNSKPDSKYHKQIINLLMLPAVKGISGGGALADSNFSIFDLDENYLKYIHDNKPSLIVDQLNAAPMDIFSAPDFIKKNINYTDIVKQKLSKQGNLLRYFPEDTRDYDLCLIAVTNNGYALEYVPEEVQLKHPNIPLKAVIYKSNTLQFVPEKVQLNHPNIPLEAVKKKNNYENNYEELKYVPEEVQLKHPNISLEAVTNNGRALEYVPYEVLLKDPNISLEAVTNNGLVLEYVPEEVQLKYPNISLEAVKKDGWALQYVPAEVQSDHPDIPLEAVKNHGIALQFVPDKVQIKYPNISLEAVKNRFRALQFVPDKVQIKYPNISLEAVKKNYDALRYVPDEIKDEIIQKLKKEQDNDELKEFKNTLNKIINL